VRLVVDANILYSVALKSDGMVADVFFNTRPLLDLCAPALIRAELMRHRPRMAKGTGKTVAQVTAIQELLFSRVSLFDMASIRETHWREAAALVLKVDINDEDYVALALHLDCPPWTGDKKLAKALNGSGVRCLTTADVRSR